ncbi:7498_t:CDS:2, partial [Dentiscutata erythropus]
KSNQTKEIDILNLNNNDKVIEDCYQYGINNEKNINNWYQGDGPIVLIEVPLDIVEKMDTIIEDLLEKQFESKTEQIEKGIDEGVEDYKGEEIVEIGGTVIDEKGINECDNRIGIRKNKHMTVEGRDLNRKDNLESGHDEDVDIVKDEIKRRVEENNHAVSIIHQRYVEDEYKASESNLKCIESDEIKRDNNSDTLRKLWYMCDGEFVGYVSGVEVDIDGVKVV